MRYGLDNFHFTRLDIAIDDKNEKPFFTIEQIKKKCEKEEFISNSEGYHFDESKFDDFDTAKTVYIGAGKSGDRERGERVGDRKEIIGIGITEKQERELPVYILIASSFMRRVLYLFPARQNEIPLSGIAEV